MLRHVMNQKLQFGNDDNIVKKLIFYAVYNIAKYKNECIKKEIGVLDVIPCRGWQTANNA